MKELSNPVQIAYAVDDAGIAAARWAADFGAGPFFLAEHILVTDVIYRGSPGEYDHSSAYGQWGNIMLELVQDHGIGPSVVKDSYASGETGLHHLAYFVEDLNITTEKLSSMGFELAMSAKAGDTRFNFVDARSLMGHFIEIYEPDERLSSFYSMVREASIGWNGKDPVREL